MLEFGFKDLVWENPGQQSHVVHIAGGIILTAAVNDLPGPEHRHASRQPHGAAPSRQDSHVDFGGSEFGGFTGIEQITTEGQFQTAGQAMAMQPADNHFIAISHGPLQVHALMGQPVEAVIMGTQGRKYLQITAGAEGFAFSGQDDHPDAFFIAYFDKGPGQLFGHLPVNGVPLFRPVHGDAADQAVNPV